MTGFVGLIRGRVELGGAWQVSRGEGIVDDLYAPVDSESPASTADIDQIEVG
jgi:hypothetical protein